jgi:hypothetical protein
MFSKKKLLCCSHHQMTNMLQQRVWTFNNGMGGSQLHESILMSGDSDAENDAHIKEVQHTSISRCSSIVLTV